MTIALRQRPLARVVAGIVSANNGAWFDPSDLSTLYQDDAGTTPVTAVEQPVGKIIDKSGNGYHATQSVTASRPVLSARKNIMLATEAMGTQSVTSLAATYTLSFTGTGSVTLSGTATGTLTGTGTDRVSLTFTPAAGTLTLTVSGGVTKAQLELGAAAGQYQRVTTTTDYDTDERYFKKFLRFDGVDDYLNLPYMGLYANGSASVVMAKDEWPFNLNQMYVSEANSTSGGKFYLPIRALSNNTIGGGCAVDSGETNFSLAIQIIPSALVITSVVDRGDTFKFYRGCNLNGESVKNKTAALTVNNLTIGARNAGGVLDGACKMKLYSLIITKSALADAQRIACERYLGRKSGVQL